MSKSLPELKRRVRPRAQIAFAIFAAVAMLFARPAALADTSLPPKAQESPQPHAVGESFTYTLKGVMSQTIYGRSPFGAIVHQKGTSTGVTGRERIAIRAVSVLGYSLHRTGSIAATFRGKSSSAQRGSGWTLVTHDGAVDDRKGSTLGGLFLLPLGFLGDRALDGGAPLQIGDRWIAKLGVPLFGMTARPRMHFEVTGTRQISGVMVVAISATGTAPVKEPIVTDDAVAMGDAVGTARVSLSCDYDARLMRVVTMDVKVVDDLHIKSSGRSGGGTVHERQHYVVALRAATGPTPLPSIPPSTR